MIQTKCGFNRFLFFVVVTASLAASAQRTKAVYPGANWELGDPEKLAWSVPELEQAHRLWHTYPPSSVFIVDSGRVVAQWGDPALRIKLSSARKSLLSALYGISVQQGTVKLDATLKELGIDDIPPLNAQERNAKVRMLLEARSGVYHTFVAGTPAMKASTPARGSHLPGTFWNYNNWDFNALGTIFEKETHPKIGEAFQDRIAKPLQMEDFRLEDMYYQRTQENGRSESVHPAYHFRMTARDMARFGYLYLQVGQWNGKQIVPASWVKDSVTSYSDTEPGEGYGYLWWVDGLDLPVKSFRADGALAKYIVVIPARNLVVVYQNHTELPDTGQGLSDAEYKKLPTISKAQLSALLKLILAAQRN